MPGTSASSALSSADGVMTVIIMPGLINRVGAGRASGLDRTSMAALAALPRFLAPTAALGKQLEVWADRVFCTRMACLAGRTLFMMKRESFDRMWWSEEGLGVWFDEAGTMCKVR